MFSNDRYSQLSKTISCLQDMKFFDKCQKTLIVDGNPNKSVENWEIIKVPRLNNQFCWANMWNAGVASARHDIILYLDSDRLLPKNYLELLLETVKDDVFVFTSRHFLTLKDLDLEDCKTFLHKGDLLLEKPFLGSVKYEPRFKGPLYGPGKNVMSGNTAFTKKTYLRLKGVDSWYCGHGAYADTDFHLTAATKGCSFLDLQVTELHYHHDKLENTKLLTEKDIYRLGLDNFIYYCKKWQLPIVYAENLALRAKIPQPVKYVRQRLEQLVLPPGDLPE